MYVYYFVHLEGDPDVWARLLRARRAKMRALANEALRDGGSDGQAHRLEVGRSRPVGRGFVIPFVWDAPPRMRGLSGDLSLQPVDAGMTQLTIRGSYQPGDGVDFQESHRSVEALVKRFLDSMSALSP